MKLKQTEYCHNCNQYVEFEFDDTTERQIIYCPKCGHEHYREIDSGTLLNIQMDMRQFHPGQDVRVAIMPEMDFTMHDNGDILYNAPLIDTRRVKGEMNGKILVESKDGDENKVNSISDRRWGRDPNQRG